MDREYLAARVATGSATDQEWDEYWAIVAQEDLIKRKVIQPTVEKKQPERERKDTAASTGAKYGIGMGSALAMILSFQLNHSVLWAIVHGICSWFYVLYRAYQGNY